MADDDMVAWLSGVLGHLEAVAVAASRSDSTTWTARDHEADSQIVRDDQGGTVVYDEGSPSDEQAGHIALHDPRAVLARVETERALVAAHCYDHTAAISTTFVMIDHEAVSVPACHVCVEALPCRTVRLLARGHRFNAPGYRDEWSPK